MNPIPAHVQRFILANHVVGLATLLDGEPWAASCFYAFDQANPSLIILSDEATKHGAAMLAHPRVAGTIAGQPSLIPQIKGVQLIATVHCLADGSDAEAYALYCQRHPIARLKRSRVWRLQLQELKFTDNSFLIGQKTHWSR